MIDRQGRDRYAELLRHFVAGLITNDKYEDGFYEIVFDEARRCEGDAVLWEIHSEIWCLYDDLYRHKLVGRHEVDKSSRRQVARWIMFLYSDRRYELPSLSDCNRPAPGCIYSLTLGLLGRNVEQHPEPDVDSDLWPYDRQEDIDEDRRHPCLLAGLSAAAA